MPHAGLAAPARCPSGYGIRPYAVGVDACIDSEPRRLPHVAFLGPLCEGAPPAGGGGENCTVAQNISGYGKVLSLRSFGAPLPLWRKRHLPRIGVVCLAEGGFSTRRGEMWLTSLLFAVTGRQEVQPFLHHHRI